MGEEGREREREGEQGKGREREKGGKMVGSAKKDRKIMREIKV